MTDVVDMKKFERERKEQELLDLCKRVTVQLKIEDWPTEKQLARLRELIDDLTGETT